MKLPFFKVSRKPPAVPETLKLLGAMVVLADGLTDAGPQLEELRRMAEVEIYKIICRNPKLKRPTLDEAMRLIKITP